MNSTSCINQQPHQQQPQKLFDPDRFLKDLIQRLRENDKDLIELSLHGNKISSQLADELAQALQCSSHIKTINLRYCCIEGGVKALIQKNLPKSVTTLSIVFCGVDDDDADSIADMLVTNTTLQTIHLGAGCIMGNRGIRAIATKGLTNNVGLQELDMSDSRVVVGDYGASVLAMALQHNCSLKRLNLRSTLVSDVGVMKLAEALSVNKSLETLNLSHTLVREKGIAALLDVLKNRNTTLRDIPLVQSQGGKNDVSSHLVQMYLSQNRAGRALLQNVSTNVALAPLLLEKIATQQEVMFGLLRESPHLWTVQ